MNYCRGHHRAFTTTDDDDDDNDADDDTPPPPTTTTTTTTSPRPSASTPCNSFSLRTTWLFSVLVWCRMWKSYIGSKWRRARERPRNTAGLSPTHHVILGTLLPPPPPAFFQTHMCTHKLTHPQFIIPAHHTHIQTSLISMCPRFPKQCVSSHLPTHSYVILLYRQLQQPSSSAFPSFPYLKTRLRASSMRIPCLLRF